jgi:hypothetical protein
MNHLVFLDAQAGELEKILSGLKSMVLKEVDSTQSAEQLVTLGDSLYFLRNNDECAVRVKATVVRVLPCENGLDEDISRTLKELQPRLQLTEDQYYHWSTSKRMLFVEFENAQKISELHIAPVMITDRTRWIDFEEICQVTEEKVKDGIKQTDSEQ